MVGIWGTDEAMSGHNVTVKNARHDHRLRSI